MNVQEQMRNVYIGVRISLREIYPDFPWDKFYEADKSVNWELWHGPLPSNYWTYVEPLEHYRWKGWEQGLEDIRKMLEDLPREVWYDGDADWVSLTDPDDDDTNWGCFCKYCGEFLRTEDGQVWFDDTEGDVCSGDDELNNENESHQPDEYKEMVWLGGDNWYKIDVAQALLYDEVWKML